MSRTDPLPAIIGEQYAAPLRSAMLMLSLIPQEAIDRAVENINHTGSFGCFTDPTAWIKAENTGNPVRWRDFMESLATFRRSLERFAPRGDNP